MSSEPHPLGETFFKEDQDEQQPALAREALIGLPGEFVRRTLPQTESDAVGLLGSFLIGASVLLGREAYCIADGRRHPPTDFLAFVGRTGQARKGTATNRAMGVITAVDPDLERLHILRGLSSGEGLISKMIDRSHKMIIQERSFLAVLPELGGLMEVMTRTGNTISYCLRQAWDGDPLHVPTKKDPLEFDDFQLGIIGHITPDELLNGLSKVSYMNGFANRFIFLKVHRSQYLPEGGEYIDYSDLAERLRRTVASVKGRGVLHRSQEAKRVWANQYERLSTPPDNLKGALCSRAEAHVLRLSLLYALLDNAHEVDVQHVQAALALWDYSEASVAEIFGAHLGDADAEKILVALAHGPQNITDIFNVFGRNKTSEWLLAKLGSMVKRGLIIQTTKEGDRKTTPAWALKKKAEIKSKGENDGDRKANVSSR